MFSKLAYSVFEQSIKDYHQFDNVDQPINNPFPKDKFNICFDGWTGRVISNIDPYAA
jgi:ribosomal protein L21E